MLIKGASRDIRDNLGRKVIDMIDPNIGEQTKNELREILGQQPRNLPCCQLRPPLIKLQKNFNTFSIYVLLMIGSWVILEMFIMPYWCFESSNLGINIHFVIVNILFLMASFMNPGRVESENDLKFMKLVEKCDPNGLCPSCETVYTRDSRHCYICN
jgi:hypothetical protein